MRVYGTTYAENLAAFREAQGVGRESGLAGGNALQFAMSAAPVLAKLDALGVGLGDEAQSALHASNLALLRFVEQSGGLKGPTEIERLANIGFKINQSSGGTVTSEQLRALSARGGAYTQNMTEAGYAHSEPIMAEMKGGAYGNALLTAGLRLSGNTYIEKVGKEALRIGLWDPTAMVLKPNGKLDHFTRSPLGAAALKEEMEDFPMFYMNRMRPLYDRMGITGDERSRENFLLLGREGGKAANLVVKAAPLLGNALSAFQKAKGIDDAGKDLQKSLSGQQKEFDAAWTDFKGSFGEKMLPFFTGVLKAGSVILRALPDVSRYSTPTSIVLQLAPKLADVLAGVDENKDSKYLPPSDRNKVNVTVVNKMDKHGFATMVTQEQAKAAVRPQTGVSRFDDKLAMTPAGGL